MASKHVAEDRWGGKIAVVVIVLLAGVWLIRAQWAVPQMGMEESTFHTVDALFTAMTTRDRQQLAHCQQLLKTHQEAGELPASAASILNGIVAQGEQGDWQAGAEKLYTFMRGQRRGL